MSHPKTLGIAALLVIACAQAPTDGGAGGATQTAGDGGSARGLAGSASLGGSSGAGGNTGKGGASGAAGASQTGGTSGSGGATQTGGTAGAAPAPIIPTTSGGNYRFSFDGFVFEVDPTKGGRVNTFSLDGKNVLTGPAANADNYGSTFWPSPQSAWNWPPPAEIDPGGYTARIDGATLILESKPSAKVNLSVTKRFAIDRTTMSVVMVYEMKNTGAAAATWAPWEITRVPPGGLTFFALGAGGTAPVGTWTPTPLDEAAGWRWFDDAALQITNGMGRKTFADGKGWIAHVARAERLLFVKTFEDVAQNAQAKDEAEIEIFVDSARKYVEVENQGAAMSLAPGATRSWTVKWYLRSLGASGSLAVGATAIVDAKMIVIP